MCFPLHDNFISQVIVGRGFRVDQAIAVFGSGKTFQATNMQRHFFRWGVPLYGRRFNLSAAQN